MKKSVWAKIGAWTYFGLVVGVKVFGSGHFEIPGKQTIDEIVAAGAISLGVTKASGTDGQK